ncbi:MAG: response regulator transcription factor [Planctomycetaceae bacterium]|nr:response regulator transcription factor [Planctomycetaceae bacterium]
MKLLVVEDDPVVGRSLQQGLSEAGHVVTWAANGEQAFDAATHETFDCITLDQMLPAMSGLEFLRRIRAQRIVTPVILVSARGTVEERVEGLDAGADDYLVKPFAFPELLARIEAVCRRIANRPAPVQQVGELRLDMSTRRVIREGREIELTPTEFSLLEFLMRHAGQVVTRKMLCEHLWDQDWDGMTNVLDVHVNRLRGKLDKGFTRSLIETARGRGYALRVAQ